MSTLQEDTEEQNSVQENKILISTFFGICFHFCSVDDWIIQWILWLISRPFFFKIQLLSALEFSTWIRQLASADISVSVVTQHHRRLTPLRLKSWGCKLLLGSVCPDWQPLLKQSSPVRLNTCLVEWQHSSYFFIISRRILHQPKYLEQPFLLWILCCEVAANIWTCWTNLYLLSILNWLYEGCFMETRIESATLQENLSNRSRTAGATRQDSRLGKC
jgi:hypothetical protein